MDPMKIRALLTALDCGRLAKAADRLGYTPSGMSRLIAGLEKDLATSLYYGTGVACRRQRPAGLFCRPSETWLPQKTGF
ncbi:LysR family transcriptional regulator [Peptococcus simiae]|uniref:LysR family transcriptional regulator n=1 Tax=Peptococcus simiae TaxID=1643805 RepID=A0ABW9GXW1_9FIRM